MQRKQRGAWLLGVIKRHLVHGKCGHIYVWPPRHFLLPPLAYFIQRTPQALHSVLWPKGPARHTGVLRAKHCGTDGGGRGGPVSKADKSKRGAHGC